MGSWDADLQPLPQITEADANNTWDHTVTYNPGDQVVHKGITYAWIAEAGAAETAPDTDTDHWARV
jgi:hypothetical protein